jgi:putative ABC transport system permease protein
MGSIAEKLNLLVSGGTRYYGDKVTISAPDGMFGFSATPLPIEKIDELRTVDGVKEVSGTIGMMLNESMDAVNFGPPPMINGSDFRGQELESFKITIAKGRELKADDFGKVLIGSDLVKKLDADIGKQVEIRGEKFEVIGIMEKTLTAPDSAVGMVLSDTQRLFVKTLPEVVRNNVEENKIVTGFTVYVEDGYDPDQVAKKINEEISGIRATGPNVFKEQIASQIGVFNNILYGIGLISLLVGSLSVINTMTMSISERTREIGVKKAVGAKTKHIMSEYLTEAGIIGFFGGLLGVGLGSVVVSVVNRAMEAGGDQIFLLTPRLVIGSFLFAIILGIIAGIFPARHAVKLNIVTALREG